ncbi:MAG: DUF2157 domain-containing protein [Nitriliruptoraceae bacterium]
MDRVTEPLERWVDAGLLSPEQAERIEAFEAQRTLSEPTAASERLTSPAEAIGYVGAALALGAVALLLSDLWDELLTGGRLALVAALTVAVFGAGLALRTAASRAMQRLTSVLFTATVAGVGWMTGVLTSDVLELEIAQVMLSVGTAMFVVALALYRWRPGALLQLATLGSALLTAGSALGQAELTPDPEWFGLTLGGVGLAWFLLAVGSWLTPRVLAEVTGALAMFLGVQVASFGDARVTALAIGAAIAAGLVVLAVRTDQLHHLVIGAVGLFVLVPQLVFEVFGDAIGAPATLLLLGLLLVLLAVGLGRAKRQVTRDDDARGGSR